METQASAAQAELLGVLADLLRKEELEACSWLGPAAWLPCPYEVAGGLWMEDDRLDDGLGSRVARELERRTHGPAPVVSAKRVLPGQGTIIVWYRHLN